MENMQIKAGGADMNARVMINKKTNTTRTAYKTFSWSSGESLQIKYDIKKNLEFSNLYMPINNNKF